jgi:uncharacterized damage-inducible protein DinB
MSLSAMLLPEYDHEMAGVRKTLERVPLERGDWAPHAKSMKLGALASHLAEIPGWVASTFASSELDLAPPDGPKYESRLHTSREELLAAFDEAVVKGRAALAAASDEDFGKPWSMLMGGQLLFTMPKGAVIRTWVLSHAIHHRAQLGVYLRLLGIPVPGLYGPSADEG